MPTAGRGEMRILLVITGLGVGGAERLVTALADHYSSLGYEVALAYFHGEAELEPSNDRVRLVNLQMTRTPLGGYINFSYFIYFICLGCQLEKGSQSNFFADRWRC